MQNWLSNSWLFECRLWNQTMACLGLKEIEVINLYNFFFLIIIMFSPKYFFKLLSYCLSLLIRAWYQHGKWYSHMFLIETHWEKSNNHTTLVKDFYALLFKRWELTFELTFVQPLLLYDGFCCFQNLPLVLLNRGKKWWHYSKNDFLTENKYAS